MTSSSATFRPLLIDALIDALGAIGDDAFAAEALADPGADLFALGMNSLQAFDLLDRLFDETGTDVDYAEFTARPTLEFLLGQGASATAASALSPGQGAS